MTDDVFDVEELRSAILVLVERDKPRPHSRFAHTMFDCFIGAIMDETLQKHEVAAADHQWQIMQDMKSMIGKYETLAKKNADYYEKAAFYDDLYPETPVVKAKATKYKNHVHKKWENEPPSPPSGYAVISSTGTYSFPVDMSTEWLTYKYTGFDENPHSHTHPPGPHEDVSAYYKSGSVLSQELFEKAIKKIKPLPPLPVH